MTTPMPEVQIAVIGTIDSSGGAGINQDIRVAALFGHKLHTCVANLSLQSENGVELIHPVEEGVIEKNLHLVLQNKALRYIKIGALSTEGQIKLLCKYLSRPRAWKVILDPVIKASRGQAFLDDAGLIELQSLIRQADYLCPNLPELAMLCKAETASFEESIRRAQDYAHQMDTSILLKGGHGRSGTLEEAFVSKDKVIRYSHPRRNWNYDHGTGCALATAFCCYLSKGFNEHEAFHRASLWVMDYYDGLNGLAETSVDNQSGSV